MNVAKADFISAGVGTFGGCTAPPAALGVADGLAVQDTVLMGLEEKGEGGVFVVVAALAAGLACVEKEEEGEG